MLRPPEVMCVSAKQAMLLHIRAVVAAMLVTQKHSQVSLGLAVCAIRELEGLLANGAYDLMYSFLTISLIRNWVQPVYL